MRKTDRWDITDYDDCGDSSQSHHASVSFGADTHEFFISGCTTAIIAKELL